MNIQQTITTHSHRYACFSRNGIGNESARKSHAFRSERTPAVCRCLLVAVLLAAFVSRAEAVEGTNTGGFVATCIDAGGTNWIYHVFTNAGASGMKFRATAAGGTVELLVVAGGGSGGGSQYNGGAGGAGGLIYTNYTVTHNTDYAVSVGPGGAELAANSTLSGNSGGNSVFGSLTAYGGGGAGTYWLSHANQNPALTGGSGGGGAGNSAGNATNGASATVVTPSQGNKGGNGHPSSGALGSGGGGGAGSAGGDGSSTKGGDGGTGLYVAAFTNWGDTNNPGWFAGGGGGGVYSGSSPGTGGKGGGGNGSASASGDAGQRNTGGGGGGPKSHNTSAAGGAGGSGIVILRYRSRPAVLPASGGDILYPTNLNGRLYGVHIFTNTLGTNYFTSTIALNLEYLVIGGGGGGGGARAGGGGAGGYRCSVPGELSGSNSAAEAVYPVSAGVAYPVVVGTGGVGGASTSTGSKGGDSWFTNIVAIGGGGGKERIATANADGGSGGGGGYLNNTEPQSGGSGTAGQGFKGGSAVGNADGFKASYGGGGGGAGSPGTDGKLISDPWGSGGTGLVSSITGVAVMRAGGGGGCQVTWGVATNYGGGVDTVGRRDGATSTGGGGAANWLGTGGAGGSGVVIIRYDMTPPRGTVFLFR